MHFNKLLSTAYSSQLPRSIWTKEAETRNFLLDDGVPQPMLRLATWLSLRGILLPQPGIQIYSWATMRQNLIPRLWSASEP